MWLVSVNPSVSVNVLFGKYKTYRGIKNSNRPFNCWNYRICLQMKICAGRVTSHLFRHTSACTQTEKKNQTAPAVQTRSCFRRTPGVFSRQDKKRWRWESKKMGERSWRSNNIHTPAVDVIRSSPLWLLHCLLSPSYWYKPADAAGKPFKGTFSPHFSCSYTLMDLFSS